MILRILAWRKTTDLAAAIGIDQSYLSIMEGGSRPMGDKYIQPLADELGASEALFLVLSKTPEEIAQLSLDEIQPLAVELFYLAFGLRYKPEEPKP
jgi:transcriptional regulator with XRE-family HTH domain